MRRVPRASSAGTAVRAGTACSAALVCVVVLSGCGGGSGGASGASGGGAATRVAGGSGAGAGVQARTWADVIGASKASVVKVSVTDCGGAPVSGSGFIVDEGVITNEHVVRNARAVVLHTAAGRDVAARVERIVAGRDLALVVADEPLGAPLRWAEGERREGEEVAVLGFPLGLPFTASRGSISGLGRTVEEREGNSAAVRVLQPGTPGTGRGTADGATAGDDAAGDAAASGEAPRTLHDLIQTDAPVNPGNSGGPLIGFDGNVQGVVTAGFLDANGIAFAIDAKDARAALRGGGRPRACAGADGAGDAVAGDAVAGDAASGGAASGAAADDAAAPGGPVGGSRTSSKSRVPRPQPQTGEGTAAPATTRTASTRTASTRVATTRVAEPTGDTPAEVVLAFYAAVNGGDYESAWGLGGRNLADSLSAFAAGYRDTAESNITIDRVSGDTVSVTIEARSSSGGGGAARRTTFEGTYVVRGGEIRSGSLKRVVRVAGPVDVVTEYYEAVNARDFDRAWELGGRNFGRSRSSFESGYARTQRSDVKVLSVRGAVVEVVLVAEEVTDGGSVRSARYRGTYVVRDGVIVSGKLRRAT